MVGRRVFGIPAGDFGFGATREGPVIVLLFEEQDPIRIRLDQLGVGSPVEYQEFLTKIITDPGFTPTIVETPSTIMNTLREIIVARYGKLPANWEDLRGQLTMAYAEVFNEIMQFKGSGARGRRRT